MLDELAREGLVTLPSAGKEPLALASCLGFLRVFPDLHVLSFDVRVARNAKALGIPSAEGYGAGR
jgi:hypothetical protein